MTELPVRIRSAAEKCDNLFRTNEQKLSQASAFILVADLTKQTKEVICISHLWIDEYCSGPALGARLWAESVSDEDDNPVVITSLPTDASTTASIVFKSPITGGLYVNTVEGNLGKSISECGCVALVLKGKMPRTGVVEITPEGCTFENIDSLHGLGTDSLSIQLKHSEAYSVLSIGPAGENLLTNAVCVCEGRETGRGGLGCVFGRKHLKALSVRGKRDSAARQVPESDIPFVRNADYMGWAPVENFTGRTDPRLFHISLNEFTRTLKRNRISCTLPPADAIMMLGGNSGCFDAVKVVERYRRCISLGIDPVFAGNYLGVFLCGCDDESEVNSCINSLADSEVDIDDLYTVNGMTVGACDYRGNAAQALSDASGFWFPLFFSAGKNMGETHQDRWATFTEDITLGLQSMGMGLSSMMLRACRVGSVQAMSMKLLPAFAARHFIPDDEAKLLASATGSAIDADYIIALGRRCKRLFYEINQVLGAYTNPAIPDHFCIDPDSNMKEDTVVPFTALLDPYVAARNVLFAKQDAKAARNK